MRVKTQNGFYDITLCRGALKKAGTLFRLDRRVLVVTDDGVPSRYAECVAAQCAKPTVITLPQGESTKCLEQYAFLLKTMVENDFTRSDCVVAVGGGVIGDLAGFAAAGFMRGVDFYNIPTTVLSQVDSSVGGKTAIDFCGVKNIVGAFWQPKGVLIDPDTLDTLPPRQVANGLAEAVKMAATCDAELFEMFESPKWEPDTVIERAVAIKKQVVEQDEREAGLRKVLNFGHTLAHAVEICGEGWYHGECVAIGMVPMCAPEVRERLIPVLQRLGLPTKPTGDLQKLLEAMAHDKKRAGDKITVVYVPRIGSFELRELNFESYIEQIEKVVAQ